MDLGTKISGTLHAGAIGLTIFGGAFFRADNPQPIRVSDVSIITSEAFEAMRTTTPKTVPDAPKEPVLETPKPIDPVEKPTPKPEPKSEPTPEVAKPEAQVEPQEQVAILAPKPEPKPRMRPAQRIAEQAAKKPDVNAKQAKETVKEVAPDENAKAVEPVVEKQATAPKEAATEIVTEADELSDFAPQKSVVPPRRPRNMQDKVARANTPKQVVKPQADNTDDTADAITKALAQAEKEAANAQTSSAPTGPALTGGERDGLVLAVQECWNVPVGLANDGSLAVVIAVEMNKDGSLASAPKLIDPTGAPTGAIKQAYEAGRRALIRCAPYALPKDKYEHWRQLEVVFNPENMVVK